jgi:hypothetical protein
MTLACARNCDRDGKRVCPTRSTLISQTLAGFAQSGSSKMARRSPTATGISEDGDMLGVRIPGRPMAFRLPSQLEGPLAPDHTERMSFTSTWRGVLIIEGLAMSDGERQHELYVTAAETQGERCKIRVSTEATAVLINCTVTSSSGLRCSQSRSRQEHRYWRL